MTHVRLCLLVGLTATIAVSSGIAQPRRLSGTERRHPDAIVLVADARTGRTIAGAHVAESRTESVFPASLFKIAIAMTLLESGSRPGERFECTGADTLDGSAHRCWLDAGHGVLELEGAIANSCNAYFRHAARGISKSTLVARARALGLLPPEYAGTITAAVLLGEAAPVTPAMLMRTALTLASRGRLAQPTLNLTGARYRPIYRGLRECVRIGTARSAWSRRTSIAGKTGTAEIAGRADLHAGWFVGFAPFERPQYAIVVLNRRGLGSDAAAIAREVIEELL